MEKIDLRQTYQLMQAHCSKEWLYLLKEQSETRTHKKKSTIYWQSEKLKSIAIILKGKVKTSSFLTDESERIYRLATDGQIIGHRGMGRDYFFPISATALEDTQVLKIPFELFESILKANSEFCYHFMLFFAEELKKSENYMSNIMNTSVTSRIALALLLNIDSFGYDKIDKQKLGYTLSRKDYANLAGTTYESTIRTLATLQDEKIIELINKEIRITDIEKLKQQVVDKFEPQNKL